MTIPDSSEASFGPANAPQLDAAQLARLRAYGTPADVVAGEYVFRTGDHSYDLVVIESGRIEIVREATRDAAEVVIVTHGPGRYLGELNLLTGGVGARGDRVGGGSGLKGRGRGEVRTSGSVCSCADEGEPPASGLPSRLASRRADVQRADLSWKP